MVCHALLSSSMGALKFNGKPISTFRAASNSSYINQLIELLDSLPSDEVFDGWDISKRLGIKKKRLLEWARNDVRLSFYCYLVPVGSGACIGYYLFGNPRAINAARKHMAKMLGGK